jgi:hypothetical protein
MQSSEPRCHRSRGVARLCRAAADVMGSGGTWRNIESEGNAGYACKTASSLEFQLIELAGSTPGASTT